jgi:hypothetical protein
MNRRRKLRAVAAVAVVGGVLGTLVATNANANGADPVVSNPGSVAVTLSNGTLDIDGAALDVGFTGLSATGTASVAADGTVSIDTLNFPPFAFELLASGGPGTGIPGTASPVAQLPWTGTIDPSTGALSVAGGLTTNVAVPLLGASQCSLGPFGLNLTSGTSGASTGTAYDPANGNANIVDHLFSIPALVFVPENAAACPQSVVDLFNSGLPFPIASTFARIGFDVNLNPAPQGTGAPASTTTTTAGATTTTTQAVTTTTAQPVTTTTAQPVTTTTAQPVTTTTAQPATTTTTRPATTTTRPATTTTTSSVLPKLTVSDVTVTEPDKGKVNATFTVSLSAPGEKVSVKYATADGTATQPSDYKKKNGTLKFNGTTLSKTVTVSVNGDTLGELDETFSLVLSDAKNATIQDGTGAGKIVDNDPPGLSIDDVAIVEGNKGTKQAVFTITMSKPDDKSVKVKYTTKDGTATAGSDYNKKSGSVSIKKGKTSIEVKVPVKGDTTNELNEVFIVELSAPEGATIVDATGIGTIVDDD